MVLNFSGLPALLKALPDDTAARHFLEAKRWDGCPTCPFCQSNHYYKLKDGKRYRCGNKDCRKDYTVTTGTFFESTKKDLHLWVAAFYLMSSHKKGISSCQLAKDINVTQRTAWFMLHRMRATMKPKTPVKLSGIVEADETYMSRKYRTDMSHLSPEEIKWRLAAKNTSSNKGMVLGMVARKGNVVVKVFDSTNGDKIKKHVKQVVAKNSFLFTDGASHYKEGLDDYKHDSVIHSRREYVKGDVHTNNIENFWGVMKRGIYGIYQQVSYKHLQAYCDEFAYRYNNRGIKDNERFELSLSKPEGRLTYQQLIHGKPKKETDTTEEESEWE